MTDSLSFDEARSPMGLQVRFTELQRVTNPSMLWIIQFFLVVVSILFCATP